MGRRARIRILIGVFAIVATSGFATCGSEREADSDDPESRGEATVDEMMEDDIRDSDR